MAIDFPNSPTLNQDYTVGTTTWTYDGAKWILKTYNSLHAVPVTAMMLWANTTYPTGWLLADGSAISRTTYADLFAAIGTTYGVGDGSSTFNIPNMPSAGSGSPKTIIKVTNSGALEPSAISHASNHTEGGSDVVTVTGNQIANYQSYRNFIINGGMSVAQRGTSTASITSQGYYSADRWQFNVSSTGTWTISTENDAPTGSGLRKSTKLLVTTSTASPSFCQFKQPIEGQNLQNIAKGTASAKQLTLSFWVKESTSAGSYPKTYICELYDNTNTRQVSATYTISAASTWEKKTITFPVDATGAFSNDNLAALDVVFGLGFSSTFTSGTLNTVWGTAVSANRYVGQTNLAANTSNYWQVTGVQLEVGSVATPFEFEPYETTLRKCQRYYMRWTHQNGAGRIGTGIATTTSSLGTLLPYKVPPRIFTGTLSTNGTLNASDGATGHTITATARQDVTCSDVYYALTLTVGGATLTAFRFYYCEGSGGSSTTYIASDMEL